MAQTSILELPFCKSQDAGSPCFSTLENFRAYIEKSLEIAEREAKRTGICTQRAVIAAEEIGKTGTVQLLRVDVVDLQRATRKIWGGGGAQGADLKLRYNRSAGLHIDVPRLMKGKPAKIRTLHPRTFVPFVNLGTLLALGVPERTRWTWLAAMLAQPWCPDPFSHNWIITVGGSPKRIDTNEGRFTPDAVAKEFGSYLDFLEQLLCVPKSQVSAVCPACDTLRVMSTDALIGDGGVCLAIERDPSFQLCSACLTGTACMARLVPGQRCELPRILASPHNQHCTYADWFNAATTGTEPPWEGDPCVPQKKEPASDPSVPETAPPEDDTSWCEDLPFASFGYTVHRNKPRWRRICSEIRSDTKKSALGGNTAPPGLAYDYGSNQGFFSVATSYKFPHLTVVSLDMHATKETNMIGRIGGMDPKAGAQHYAKLRKLALENNVICDVKFGPETFQRLWEHRVRARYQYVLSVFHWLPIYTTAALYDVLSRLLLNARTTFLELPGAHERHKLSGRFGKLYERVEGNETAPVIMAAAVAHGLRVDVKHLSVGSDGRVLYRVDLLGEPESGAYTGKCNLALEAMRCRNDTPFSTCPR
eukprot:TRINITY_DN23820_c0_g1_i1.p1 TRINITY_DN23820_c0_g1~~TRINITY_DN23820_c0_g1_i1.p1  ORF type:complete len:591 (-),score=54.98 TRINITY_DN23820_c0_g1_i1:29-1801(-)